MRPTSTSAASTEGPVRAIFIRAPWVAEHGEDVEVLARLDGHPVAVRQGSMLAVSFHPELGDEQRVHRLFLEAVKRRRAPGGS